ncbi:M23 family metallopeptidase [Streptomyces sampsonii]|nr:M23 family metallopeptidase [Streptomyces sampsonii]
MQTPVRDTERTPDGEPPAPEEHEEREEQKEHETRPDPARRKRRGPGPFLLLVLPTLTVLLAAAVFLVATDRLSGLLGGDDGDAAPAPQAVTDRVDPSLLPWLRKAADQCDTLRPSVLAAQIDLLSGWSNDGAALSGPSGLAGFTPAQWREWGEDANGNGTSSPKDPADALVALGRWDCALAERMTESRTRGTVNGDLLDLTLAAYDQDEAAVTKAGRVPEPALPYVRKIKQLARQYAQFDTAPSPLPDAGAPPRDGYLRRPLLTTTLSSAFGTRQHPLSGVTKLHTGVDFPAPQGTPVTAAGPGTVTFAGLTQAYGNRVVIDHGKANGKRLQTTYSHLSALNTTQGSTVIPGTTLGWVGSTGLSTGPHLHFEVMVEGQYTDPMPWLEGGG